MDDPLPSTTEDIIRQCPRFRILVVGKSGVGKSSLINRAFKVNLPSVSHRQPGRSDIDTPITSSDNLRFVLHDSQGFEPGEVDNLKIVQDFILDRSRQQKLEDRLHAIWLCIEIPRAGGRVLEKGDETFLKNSVQVGGVPVIVVFTKYDLLVATKQMSLLRKGIFDQVRATDEAERTFEETCICLLRRVNATIPYAKVSDRTGYHPTVANLIQITYDFVLRHVEGDVWLIWAMAQRANMRLKIEASIEVGKKRYWLGLASSVFFPGKTLRQCLIVIHKDIISVWQFRDNEKLLLGEQFKGMIRLLVEDLGPDAPDPNSGVSENLGTLQKTVTIATAMSPPLASATAALGIVFTAGNWLYHGYEKTPSTLRCLMGYIVDLTLIMDRLFWFSLKSQRTGSISMQELEEAFNAYNNSEDQKEIHRAIRAYVGRSGFAQHINSNNAHEEVIRLIQSHRCDVSKNEN